MAPLAPIRDQIKDAMVARLYTINAGEDYWATPSLVTRALLSIDQYKAELAIGPVLGVMRSSGSRLEQVGQTAEFDDDSLVTIWGYVRGDSVVSADTALERLWVDVTRCFLAETTLAGLVRNLWPEGPTDTDGGALEPLAFFAQDWLVMANQSFAPGA